MVTESPDTFSPGREAARIDALIDNVRCSIEPPREYRAALISAAVTGKMNARKGAV
jgi:hypothetical protein